MVKKLGRALGASLVWSESCASSISYLARFIMRGSSVGRFGEVASDLVARRGAAKALSLAFEE